MESYIVLLTIVGTTLLILFWASLIIWTYRDIRDRTRDLSLQVVSVFLVMAFSLFGLLLYLVLRPRETLEEAYNRSLEEEALLRDIGEETACPSCRRFVEKDFIYCPYCRSQLREECARCGRALSFSWAACPTCGHERPMPLQVPLTSQPKESTGTRVRSPLRQAEGGGMMAQEAAWAPASAEAPAEAGRETGVGP